MNWHTETPDSTLHRIGSSSNGLSEESALERLEKHGQNVLDEKPPKTFLERFVNQLKDFMVLVLLAAAFVSATVAFAGEEPNGWVEPVIIVAIVILNAVIGVLQESKAEAALSALKNLAAPRSCVVRDGQKKAIDSSMVVPGDIVILEAGDYVPADGRLIEAASLKCDESSLTGESVPVEKDSAALLDVTSQLADRINMCYSGSFVTYGRAVMVVTATGMHTEIGKIASLLANEDEGDTPLQKKLAQLGRTLGLLVLGLCAIVFIVGLLTLKSSNDNILHIFMTSVSLAVAAIPEGLPAVVTVVLALGVQKMVKRNAIIRKLPAVETLGSASVICSDKTGTLTQNRMTLIRAWTPDSNSPCILSEDKLSDGVKKLIEYAALCCDGSVTIDKSGKETHIGDPTETAIISSLVKNAVDHDSLKKKYPRICEIPFDSQRKLMTTVHNIDGRIISITKGAPDILLALCDHCDTGKADTINSRFGSDALRVIAVAYRELDSIPEAPTPEQLECHLNFMGLLGMVDPPREEVKDAINECAQAGIRPIMITGDHIVTASAIARELDILREGDEALSGDQLAAMSDDELERNIRKYSVYARVTPSDKIRIVKAWQKSGETVAMTGDGVNDAPALKAADIGCAMGITGTSVAKGASDVILTDDNFATIVSATREGRGIFDNIRKCVYFLLSCNFSEIVTVFIAMLIWKVSALEAMHLLMINLITDSLLALALGVDPIDKNIMKRRPRRASESIFAGGYGWRTLLHGIFIGAASLGAFAIGYTGGMETAQTMTFGVLALSQLVYAFAVRSNSPLFSAGVGSNKYLWGAALSSGAVAFAVMLIPPISAVFKLTSLSGNQWLFVILLSIAPFIAVELEKIIVWILKKFITIGD